MGAPPEVQALVTKFREGADYYASSSFKEMSLRSEFLNPVLKALGWDPDNPGLDVANREVTQEDTLIIDGEGKAPDYAFLIDGRWQWFLEAKRPGVNIETGRDPAYQIRRYCWNAGLPLGVVTDFEEWAVYDCRFEPQPGDAAAVARLLYFGFEELDAQWEELSNLLGRVSVGQGSIARFNVVNPAPRGTLTVDQAFLKEISEWREALAADVALNNPAMGVIDLNKAVQNLIDRVIFLRIAEARGLEGFGDLQAAAADENSGVYARLLGLFKRADNRYNSGLFHFSKSKDQSGDPDEAASALVVSDAPLRYIIDRLYYPHPYEFSAMPADILGRVYEQFLGATITLKNHKATVEEKPEVRKAGGVYYTPVPIVEYIVEETIGPLLDGVAPSDVAKLRILDPACGSGSFLIAAYQYLIDWHTGYYAKTPRNAKKYLDKRSDGGVRLNTAERKRILLANIFGVDIDPQAVEVTKLSLLLKVIEGQTQLELATGRILPDLDANIRCGNSLIDLDFPLPLDVTEEERQQYNPFNWAESFPEIMSNGGFDAIVGNPPYLNIDAVWGRKDLRLAYIKSRYSKIHTDKTDILFYFLARAIEICKGEIGFIISRSFLEADKAQKLRGWLASNARVREVLDFREAIVFPRVGINTAIVRFTQSKAVKEGTFRQYRNKSLPPGYRPDHLRDPEHFTRNTAPLSTLGTESWIVTDTGNAALLAKIDAAGDRVSQILHVGKGMETGSNDSFVVPASEHALQDSAVDRAPDGGCEIGTLSRTLVPPQTVLVVRHRQPVRIVNRDPAMAVLDMEGRRRVHIERRHAIVRVLTQGHRERDPALLHDVVAGADIEHRVHLEHQVIEADHVRRATSDGERVVAADQVEEAHFAPVDRDTVGELEAHDVAVERIALPQVGDDQHDMAQTLLTGVESADDPSRLEGRGQARLAEDRLMPNPERIVESEQSSNPSLGAQCVIAELGFDAGRLQCRGQLVEVLSTVGCPAEVAEVVDLIRMNRQAPRSIIYAEAQCAVGPGRSLLHAEDLRGERRPGVHGRGAHTHVREIDEHRLTSFRRFPRR